MVRSIKKSARNVKIAVLGLDNAGKTTLITRHLGIDENTEPTFGYRIFTVSYGIKEEGERTLTVVDIGGQREFKKYWNNYFEGVDGIVFVLDITETRPYGEYLNEALQQAVPVVVFANKADLAPETTLESIGGVEKYADVKVFKCSAASGEGVSEGFEWLLNRIENVFCQGFH